jgi:hypothetical protein
MATHFTSWLRVLGVALGRYSRTWDNASNRTEVQEQGIKDLEMIRHFRKNGLIDLRVAIGFQEKSGYKILQKSGYQFRIRNLQVKRRVNYSSTDLTTARIFADKLYSS